MGITQTTSAVMIFLTGLLPASCHKTAPVKKATPSAVAAIGTNGVVSANRDLGEISLTNHNDTCLWLPTGESFTLTPKLLDKHNVQITLSLESKNDYGETHNFAVTQVIAQPGKPLEVAVGDLNLTFTPRVNQE
jgi:hypothetical protein